MGHDYYYDSPARRWLKAVVSCLVGTGIVGAGFWVLTGDGNAQPTANLRTPASTRVAVAVRTEPTDAPALDPPAEPSTSTSAGAPPTSPAASAPPPAPTVTLAPSTTESAAGGYPMSDDGAPLPLIVTYDTDTITITGFVPSQAAKDRIGLLATANSKTEARLANNLIVNPNVPIGVGVRVLELNSARFPEGSAELRPEHAAEFERVAAVMEALPNVTVLVVGHADQRGDEAVNYAISTERAAAVVDFLTYLGVSPTRLSSRAVGEADLLTLADDNTALALNRRTEFVFYGVLIE